MPELKCTVQTCVHNNQFLCDLEKIQVGGDSAKTAQETCCDSFQERKEGSYMNYSGQQMASDCASVDCMRAESVSRAATPARAAQRNVLRSSAVLQDRCNIDEKKIRDSFSGFSLC